MANKYELLSNIATITNGKRNAQDAIENGAYPLFDRSSLPKRSNQYLYDKTAIIVAGEGKSFLPKYYSGKFDLHQRCYAIFDIRNDYIPKYIYYYIHWNQPYFQSVYIGSTVPSLRLGHFENMPIKSIEIEKQKDVVNILEKIESLILIKQSELIRLDELIKSRFIGREVVA